MKTKVYLGVLLGMMLMASCSEDTSAIDDLKNAEDQLLAMGLYEGEWRTGTRSTVIGKGNLAVKSDLMEFVLPEEWIFSLLKSRQESYNRLDDLYSDDPFYSSSSAPQFHGVVQYIHYTWQGISNKASYAEMENVETRFDPVTDDVYSFTMSVDDTLYRVDLMLIGKATSIFDLNTRMWTIMIPYSEIAVINLKTHQTIDEFVEEMPMLVFNTTKKII